MQQKYQQNKASEAKIAEHLSHCDADFALPLSGRADINDYAKKIVSKATTFEAWSGGTLVGLVAAYCNDSEKRIAYITNVSVLREWAGQGIASRLVNQCAKFVKTLGMRQISLQVASADMSAVTLYEKCGFIAGKANAPFVTMNLHLENWGEHEQRS